MGKLVELVAAGTLNPVIDSTFPLREAAAADELIDANKMFGRIVLRVDEPE